MLLKNEVAEIIKEFGRKEGDSGSAEVQIALLTKRIDQISQHLSKHLKDHSSKRGLMKLIGHRKSLLKFLGKNDSAKYQNVIQKLGIRK